MSSFPFVLDFMLASAYVSNTAQDTILLIFVKIFLWSSNNRCSMFYFLSQPYSKKLFVSWIREHTPAVLMKSGVNILWFYWEVSRDLPHFLANLQGIFSESLRLLGSCTHLHTVPVLQLLSLHDAQPFLPPWTAPTHCYQHPPVLKGELLFYQWGGSSMRRAFNLSFLPSTILCAQNPFFLAAFR